MVLLTGFNYRTIPTNCPSVHKISPPPPGQHNSHVKVVHHHTLKITHKQTSIWKKNTNLTKTGISKDVILTFYSNVFNRK